MHAKPWGLLQDAECSPGSDILPEASASGESKRKWLQLRQRSEFGILKNKMSSLGSLNVTHSSKQVPLAVSDQGMSLSFMAGCPWSCRKVKQIVAMLEFCPQSLTAEAQSFQTLEVALWQQTWHRQPSKKTIISPPD